MHRPLLRTCAALVATTTLLWGCGDDDGDAGEADATTTTAPDSSTASTGSDEEPQATTTSEQPATTTSEAGEDPATDLALRGDGLGLVNLGADPDAAVAAVSGVLGDPTLDTGWEPAFSTYGTCPGTEIRGVEWSGLVLLFTDGQTDHGSGRHLFAWRLDSTPPPLATAAGFGLGARTSDAEELYPGAVEVVPPEEPFPGLVLIDADGGRITGFLEGDVVTNLEAGTPCGE